MSLDIKETTIIEIQMKEKKNRINKIKIFLKDSIILSLHSDQEKERELGKNK